MKFAVVVVVLVSLAVAAVATFAEEARVFPPNRKLEVIVCNGPSKVRLPAYTLNKSDKFLLVNVAKHSSNPCNGEVHTVPADSSAYLMKRADYVSSGWKDSDARIVDITETEFVVVIVSAERLSDFAAVSADRELLRPLHRQRPHAPRFGAKPQQRQSMVTKREVISRLSTTEYYDLSAGLSGAKSVTIGGSTVTINTRYTLATGNDNAAQFIAQYLRSVGYTDVSLQPFTYSGKRTNNIIAIKRGASLPNEIVVVGAHMDSTSQSASTSAPGCIDNGSGTVGVLLAAKAMANVTSARTIYYVLFSAEEQGLIGSEYFVEQADSSNLNIVSALTMDMIGYSSRYYGVLIEGTNDADIRTLMDTYESNINEFTTLTTEKAYYSYGSDHVSFQRAGIPAFLAIEQDNTDYPGYHRTTDQINYLNTNQSVDIVKGIVGALYDIAESQ